MLDRRGLTAYLLITFGLTYTVDSLLIAAGFRITTLPAIAGQWAIAATMWIPAIAAWLTVRFISREDISTLKLRFGSLRPYLTTMCVIPALYALIYGVSWLLGLGKPDWNLQWLRGLLAQADAKGELPAPQYFWPALFLLTLFVTPFINALFGLGEEIGWRGYLLPHLMPLGHTRAYLLTGLIWGLWHAPLVLIGFNYPGHPYLGVAMMSLFTTALGLYIGAMAQRHESTLLAGWMHGLINSQGYGIWRILFPTMNPLLGGAAGLVGILVWATAGLWVIRHEPGNEGSLAENLPPHGSKSPRTTDS